jgi:hypothetical protein
MPTILELFKGSPQDLAVSPTDSSSKSEFVKSIKSFADQELSGIRVKSLVDVNNPLIYGTGTIRIATRSIETTEIQKQAVVESIGTSQNTGGSLNIASKISEARDAVTSKLGFPKNLIPSTVIADPKFKQSEEQDIMTTLADIKKSGEGNLLGKYLKSTGGGNPRTLGKQALGKGVGLIKDKIRDSIMGKQAIVDPITGERLSNYSSKEEKTYSATASKILRDGNRLSLEDRGFSDTYRLDSPPPVGDKVNMIGPSDDYSRDEVEGLNLVPFWVSGMDSSKPVYFRALLNSINETVTPTWNSSRFIGNPYNYYTYSSVERTLSFNLMIYCMNPTELAKNWEKIEYLTSKTYPTIPENENYVDAPFIKFRLGNMYVDKVAFIESLTYTIDENSGWETDLEGFFLPKLIEVAATFKFVEWEGIENALYNYSRTKEANKLLKEYRERVLQRKEGLGVIISRENVPKINDLGVEAVKPPAITFVKGGKVGPSKAPTNVNTGKSESTPSDVSMKKVGASGIDEILQELYG